MLEDGRNKGEKKDSNPLAERFETLTKNGGSCFFDADEYEEIIDFYLDQNNLKMAEHATDIATRQYLFSVVFQLRKAQILGATEKSQEALAVLATAEMMEPSNPELFMTRGAIYSQMGLTEQAIENYKKAAICDPEHADEVYLALAFEFENTSRFSDAIFYLKKAIEINPENEAALYELAFCYELGGKHEESAKYYTDYLEKYPYAETAWFNLGVAYNRLKLFEKAIDAYDYAIAVNQKFASAYFNKANSLAHLGRYDEAIEVYKETFGCEEPDANTFYYIGECYEKKEEYEHALANYNKAVKLDPHMADAWMGIGMVLDYQNRITEGIHYVKKALELDQENADFWYIYGDVQNKMGFQEEAATAYRKVAELDPYIIDIWLDHSALLVEMEHVGEALEVLAEGIKHHPTNAELQYRMAGCLMRAGEKQEAMGFLQTALNIDYDKHNELFDFLPQLKHNAAVLEIIESYKK